MLLAGHPRPTGQPVTCRMISATDRTTEATNWSTVRGQEPPRTRRRKSAYSRLLKTRPAWYGFLESRMTTAPAMCSTTTQPPPPLQAKANSGQLPSSAIVFPLFFSTPLPGELPGKTKVRRAGALPGALPVRFQCAGGSVISFEVLDGVTARQGDLALGLSRQQQHLLAVLALAGGAPVGRERLEEVLWDSRAPYPEHGVERVASELRRELRRVSPDDDPVPASDGGYRLLVTQEQVDVLRFRARCAEARRAQGAESVEIMRHALREWGSKAAGLHGAHPLRGLPGQWADSTQYMLRTEYRDAVIHCLAHGMNNRDYEPVLAECEQRAVDDPHALLDKEFVELWLHAACYAGNSARVREIHRRAMAAAARAGERLEVSVPSLDAPSRADALHGAPSGPSPTPVAVTRGTVDVDEVNGVAVAVDADHAAGRIEGDARARNVRPGGELIGVRLRQGS